WGAAQRGGGALRLRRRDRRAPPGRARRRHHHRLLQPDDNGEALTSDEFDLFFLLLTVAGNETTRNATAGGMLALFEHPEQWQRLLEDPGLIPAAAEEIVRWVSPVNMFRRTAMQDTELGGQQVAAGDKVVLFYASANRDEAVFAAPEVFDVS